MTETFSIIPASGKVFFVLVPLALLLVSILLLFGYISYSSHHVRFELEKQTLRIRGDLYGRQISLSHLNLADARVVNIEQDRNLRPVRRTNGTGLPGYRAGWFRLQDGEKALLFVTDPSSVVYVPTNEGYAVLLSTSDPQRFLSALKQRAQVA